MKSDCAASVVEVVDDCTLLVGVDLRHRHPDGEWEASVEVCDEDGVCLRTGSQWR